MQQKELRILYEDTSLLVCVKPAGIASQGGSIFQTDLTDLLKTLLKKLLMKIWAEEIYTLFLQPIRKFKLISLPNKRVYFLGKYILKQCLSIFNLPLYHHIQMANPLQKARFYVI